MLKHQEKEINQLTINKTWSALAHLGKKCENLVKARLALETLIDNFGTLGF